MSEERTWIEEDCIPLTDAQLAKLRLNAPVLYSAWEVSGESRFWRRYLAQRQGPWAVSDIFRREA